MPPLKSFLKKPSKFMLFFHIWNANFSVTPIKPPNVHDQAKTSQKTLSENNGKTFSVIMPSFTCRGWAYLRKLQYNIMFFQKEKEYDIVVCATGRKVPLEGFERRSMEAQVGKMLEHVARFCFSFWIVLGRIDIEGWMSFLFRCQ